MNKDKTLKKSSGFINTSIEKIIRKRQGSTISHYGIKRRSGRYPWGSGDDGYQRDGSFLKYVDDLKSKGLSEVEIAKGMGINTRQLRERKSIAKAEKRAADSALAARLHEKGYSNVAIGARMGINESSVRSLLDPVLIERAASTSMTATILKDAVDSKKFIDIGSGTEQHMGISRTKLNTAVALLIEDGYVVNNILVQQVGTGKHTTMKVLSPPGTTLSEVSANRDKIGMVSEYSEDNGRSFLGLEPIRSVSGDKVFIKYDEDGGGDKDGVIQLRRGVPEIDLGSASYAQVRIGVNGTHYMKGMAMYADDIPDGYDIVYNTNKSKSTPANDVFKKMSDDPDNPFGTTLRQKHYIDANGNTQLSALNIVGSLPGAGEEGSWGKWSKSISSQVLSKQTPSLAQRQLNLVKDLKREEFDEIMSITNPSVRKTLLNEFADEVEASAVHLKAAALPRQASQVLLPFSSIKEKEVYAPNFRDGESVVLIRHPHGGIFEIPTLTVNNSNAEAKSIIGQAKDAIGIHPKVAKTLSGADFDGDTVIVIPNNSKVIKTAPSLKALEDFDPRITYKGYPGMPKMSNTTKQLEMGKVSNLITDMTIKGASFDEISRAVKHSMVVIDAEKHNLNYKQSFIDNGIGLLKEKYQGSSSSGASTLISRAKSTVYLPQRKEGQFTKDPITGKTKRSFIDPNTGTKLYEETGSTFKNKEGRIIKRISKTTKMAEAKDAHTLSSGTVMEKIYADHANSLKGLAKQARQLALKTKNIVYSPSARMTFKNEVDSLRAKLSLAFRNKPLERKAQVMANKWIANKRKLNPDIEPAALKKMKAQALEEARARFGAKKHNIHITDKEWLAIQAGAISSSTLSKIMANTDKARLKELATPRTKQPLSSSKTIRARSMLANGYTRAEVADALGVPISTIEAALEEVK